MSDKKLITRDVRSERDIIGFFDENAAGYREQHGNAAGLLNYRVELISRFARPGENDTVLDIGCGPGHHLLAIAAGIGKGIGVDFSEEMIRMARQNTGHTPFKEKLNFRLDNASQLQTVENDSIDLVLCIGALEHMPEKDKVFRQIFRVLSRKGKIFILTPNGDFVWYSKIAPLLKLQTRHLSTDHFLDRHAFHNLLIRAGFTQIDIRYWNFVPKGDMNNFLGHLLRLLEVFGKIFHIRSFRGGLMAIAQKP